MKAIQLTLTSLLFSLPAFAEDQPIVLWQDFETSMSSKDVLEKAKEMKDTSKLGKEKVGVKIKFVDYGDDNILLVSKRGETYSNTESAHCSMVARRSVRTVGELTSVYWCFDQPATKRNVPEDNRLLWLELYVHDDNKGIVTVRPFDKVLDALKNKYPFISNTDLLDKSSLGLSVKEKLSCDPISDGMIFDGGDVYVMLAGEGGLAGGLNAKIRYVPKEPYLSSLHSACSAKLEKDKSREDL